jgi:hypothetical protein
MNWLGVLPASASAIVVIGGFVGLTVAIGWIVDRTIKHEVRADHNDLAGFILAVIGVVYAVLLAFVAIGVWERFEQAESRTYEEAGSLALVYRDVGDFPGGAQVRESLRDYVKLVVDREWPAMEDGGQSDAANALLEQIDGRIRSLPVRTLSQEDLHQQLLTAMNQALADRDTRLSEDATGINRLLWFVLVVGAIVTVGFTYLFGFRQEAMRYVMTGSLGVLIGLVLFLTVSLDYPFRGAITVPPDAFERALDTFRAIGT